VGTGIPVPVADGEPVVTVVLPVGIGTAVVTVAFIYTDEREEEMLLTTEE